MRYTLITFSETDAREFEKREPLRNLEGAIEKVAAILARGIYILRPDRHSQLIEESAEGLRKLGVHYAVVSFELEPETSHLYMPRDLKLSTQAKQVMDAWDKDPGPDLRAP
ncbi:MAG: hypothetical protein P4L99_04815 [Chthoniobacter sp.]|nr:hypothetical protein [Chthoniobacter sp.]